jgi:hypothetical protein
VETELQLEPGVETLELPSGEEGLLDAVSDDQVQVKKSLNLAMIMVWGLSVVLLGLLVMGWKLLRQF